MVVFFCICNKDLVRLGCLAKLDFSFWSPDLEPCLRQIRDGNLGTSLLLRISRKCCVFLKGYETNGVYSGLDVENNCLHLYGFEKCLLDVFSLHRYFVLASCLERIGGNV